MKLYLITDGSYTENYKSDPRQPTLPTQECLVIAADGPESPAVTDAVRDFAEHMDIDQSEVAVNGIAEPVSPEPIEAEHGDVKCPCCGWVDQPRSDRCYNCGVRFND